MPEVLTPEILSGRDLDTAAAAIIEPRPLLDVSGCTRQHDSVSPQGAWVHTHISNHADGCVLLPRPFSSELPLAWKLVEHFQGLGYMVSTNASSAGGYWCCLYPPKGAFIESATVEKASEAICLAALKALEMKQS